MFEDWLSNHPYLVFTFKLSERRFLETWKEIQNGPGRVLEIGAPSALTAPLVVEKGYEIDGINLGEPGKQVVYHMNNLDGRSVAVKAELLDLEKHRLPFEDGTFDLVLCCEVLEHLFWDPTHMMAEINRVLKMDGRLILSTPNIVSWRAIGSIIAGYNPMFYSSYPPGPPEPRHAREYTPWEVRDLLECSGFEILTHTTVPVRDDHGSDSEYYAWTRQVASLGPKSDRAPTSDLRQDVILVNGRKCRPDVARPEWLYAKA